jgi:spermidine synthase
VKRVERLGEAKTPDGTTLTLYRHDGAYLIRADGVELMSTRRHKSEDALAEIVCAPLRDRAGVNALIGGLGLGFTLRAALASLGPDARVIVAEIVKGVIDWNRKPEFGISPDLLADPRVDLRHADVADVLRANPRQFDAIMLDVDNGADPLTTSGNAQLYGDAGIRMTIDALRPGGSVAWWSAQADPNFARLLRGAGLTVEVVKVHAHGNSGSQHTLFVGQTG